MHKAVSKFNFYYKQHEYIYQSGLDIKNTDPEDIMASLNLKARDLHKQNPVNQIDIKDKLKMTKADEPVTPNLLASEVAE